MSVLTNLILTELDSLKDRIKSGNCNLSEEEAMDILKIVAHESLSKDQACSFLNVGKSKFAEMMEKGEIPRGRKLRGFNEHRWYKDKLIRAVNKRTEENKSPN